MPGGETAGRRSGRAPTSVLADVAGCSPSGDVVLVGHGHFSRVLIGAVDRPAGHRGRPVRDGRRRLGSARHERGTPRLDHVNLRGRSDDDPAHAGQRDVAAVVALVHELAEYEQAADECQLTADQLRAALFGPAPALFGHVAEADGEVVGFALWFLKFSTWRGVHGIYLEDLYVRPTHRGSGLGGRCSSQLAAVCAERGYARLEWAVLDWNEPAIGFYRAIGAVAERRVDDVPARRRALDALGRRLTPPALSVGRRGSSGSSPSTTAGTAR